MRDEFRSSAPELFRIVDETKYPSPPAASRLHAGMEITRGFWRPGSGQKNAGLKAVTLIATLNPVSQVLW